MSPPKSISTEPRRDEEQGVELGLSREIPEEIRRREVELDSHERAQKRSRRREVELDSQERAQKRSGGRRWSWTLKRESRRDQEEGSGAGLSWTLKREPRRDQEEESGAGLSRESPIEFKSWGMELDSQVRQPRRAQEEGGGVGLSSERVQKRSRGGIWSWTLKRETKSREMELDSHNWMVCPCCRVVPRQLLFGHCPCDFAPHS